MDSLKKIINDKFMNSTDILVFDSQRTAREYLKLFVFENPDEIISSDRAIGIDQLKQLIKQSDGNPSTLLDKYSFLYAFCHNKENEKDVRLLTGRIIDYDCLVRILRNANGITSLEDFSFKSIRLKNALIHLRDAYSDYLKSNNLSDTAYDEFRILPRDKRYVLVVPESSIEMQKLIRKIGQGIFDEINLSKEAKDVKRIHFYSNERIEIREVFKDVINKLENGAKASDIIITAADLQRSQKYIEKEAEAVGLKLIYNQRTPFVMTPCGMLLSSLIEFMRSKSWHAVHGLSQLQSLGSMAKGRLQRISMMMIDIQAYDIRSLKHRLIGYKPKSQSQIEELKKDTDFLYSLGGDKELNEIWNSFLGYFQIPLDKKAEGWMESEEIIRYAGVTDDNYHAVIALMSSLTCSSSVADNGIKVFEYGSDILYPAAVRYIIGLSEQTMTVSYSDYSFLPYYQKSDNQIQIDTSKELLRSYTVASSELKISGSSSCFGAVHSFPVFFYGKENASIEETEETSSNCEVEELKKKRADGPEELWKGVCFQDGDSGFISGSNIDYAEKCLLRAKLSNQKTMRNSRSRWSPTDQNQATEGNIMHAVISEYLKTSFSFNERLLVSILQRKCIESGLTGREVAFFLKKYEEGIKGLLNLINSLHAQSICCEKDIGDGNIPILKNSRADLIIRAEDDTDVIIDIKTGGIDKFRKSDQLSLYSMLLDPNGADNIRNIFFSIRNNEMLEREVESIDLDKIIDAAKQQKWTVASKADDCQNCQFGGICRRGYFA